MGSSLRLFGCAVGFAFGVVFMTVGLGSAIVCLLLAALGYGAVLLAERSDVKLPLNRSSHAEDTPVPAGGFEFEHGRQVEVPEDASTPLAAEAEYGWPWPRSDDEEQAEEDLAPVTHASA
jgi:uncharacterized membrane protein